MSCYCNVGTLEFDKPISDNLRNFIDDLWPLGVDVHEDTIEFDDYYTNFIEDDTDSLIEAAEKENYKINGKIKYFDGPDTDGYVFVKDNEMCLRSVEDAWDIEVSDEDLIRALESRGYHVQKEEEYRNELDEYDDGR